MSKNDLSFATEDRPHKPVLLREVLEALAPRDGEIMVDGTFGAGGYSRAILDSANCELYGIDRDPTAVATGKKLEAEYDGRFHMVEGCFGDMAKLLPAAGAQQVDGIVLDIGVSSMQLDQADRGFSFREDGPLDMRMSMSGPTAGDFVNTAEEEDIANVVYRYGEERASRKVARKIIEMRAEEPFTTTSQLARAVRSVVRKSKDGIDPATRTFQALRIYVNDELGELERAMDAAETLLKPGGRLVVVTFHSLEDRQVKTFMKERSGDPNKMSRRLPGEPEVAIPTFTTITRKAVTGQKDEIRANPRARSAKLRAVARNDQPATSQGGLK
ncbi:MAG: 16S rRNA (cytosine(1402)-N(4))-methyltransferase RsmH [Thalassospira sp.]|uniref:16S rRNA (cytosine(1402)-N(4))-methyltransferase RsmH n=1 Tax=Thalassospira sp. TaxID=1912094 RepID=UPI001B0FCE3D|nr:16S rRNA (cytosine(1402)-N(4))-methyltransferase RsmH [Thalassospira sp.]MBO6579991.1 16S rRNA (cytosine(1402)-N(4))-methyltransferase RsmH [Thalassospira sp.]MBO6816984.1 16S rRNA (cytosine(1402)-N(4))-methyltransferase RsmH [Thalassospira sp.]MBO6886967.1 16S rRNA (cytosine(1402)-N(4))-methyltransferase RsmH [Thalassospira sp.]